MDRTKFYKLDKDRATALAATLTDVPITETATGDLSFSGVVWGVHLSVLYRCHDETLQVTWQQKPFWVSQAQIWAAIHKKLAESGPVEELQV